MNVCAKKAMFVTLGWRHKATFSGCFMKNLTGCQSFSLPDFEVPGCSGRVKEFNKVERSRSAYCMWSNKDRKWIWEFYLLLALLRISPEVWSMDRAVCLGFLIKYCKSAGIFMLFVQKCRTEKKSFMHSLVFMHIVIWALGFNDRNINTSCGNRWRSFIQF